MRNTLTREKLIEAQHTFDCEDWKENIQEILESSDENEILIQDKYLDLIKQKATWEQILFCKTLNLDLKMNLPQEAINFVLEKIWFCEVIKYNEFKIFYKGNGKKLFLLNSKTKKFWIDYHEIFEVLEENYSLKGNEMRDIVNSILEEHFKLEGYTPEGLIYEF